MDTYPCSIYKYLCIIVYLLDIHVNQAYYVILSANIYYFTSFLSY